MIDRHHLNILREVERRGSLTAAARALNLSQSALSHAIKRLEQQLETTLWHKEGRGLRLTQAGSYLLALGNRLLPQFEHAENIIAQMAKGQRGSLRIGMECHPCYQWLLKVVNPFLQRWPEVDVDVKQRFQFGGMGALFSYEIDLLITPDPLFKTGVEFTPVFDYEQMLAVASSHPLASLDWVDPVDLKEQTLITYPVDIERQDIFNQFLLPANVMPRQQKVIETTDIMLQMVAAGRGVTALPGWLLKEYSSKLPIKAVALGKAGVKKKIYVGIRDHDRQTDYICSFIEMCLSGDVTGSFT